MSAFTIDCYVVFRKALGVNVRYENLIVLATAGDYVDFRVDLKPMIHNGRHLSFGVEHSVYAVAIPDSANSPTGDCYVYIDGALAGHVPCDMPRYVIRNVTTIGRCFPSTATLLNGTLGAMTLRACEGTAVPTPAPPTPLPMTCELRPVLDLVSPGGYTSPTMFGGGVTIEMKLRVDSLPDTYAFIAFFFNEYVSDGVGVVLRGEPPGVVWQQDLQFALPPVPITFGVEHAIKIVLVPTDVSSRSPACHMYMWVDGTLVRDRPLNSDVPYKVRKETVFRSFNGTLRDFRLSACEAQTDVPAPATGAPGPAGTQTPAAETPEPATEGSLTLEPVSPAPAPSTGSPAPPTDTGHGTGAPVTPAATPLPMTCELRPVLDLVSPGGYTSPTMFGGGVTIEMKLRVDSLPGTYTFVASFSNGDITDLAAVALQPEPPGVVWRQENQRALPPVQVSLGMEHAIKIVLVPTVMPPNLPACHMYMWVDGMLVRDTPLSSDVQYALRKETVFRSFNGTLRDFRLSACESQTDVPAPATGAPGPAGTQTPAAETPEPAAVTNAPTTAPDTAAPASTTAPSSAPTEAATRRRRCRHCHLQHRRHLPLLPLAAPRHRVTHRPPLALCRLGHTHSSLNPTQTQTHRTRLFL
eukprot:TRINITY_DN26821_c0_g1_i1.p1 TRINITY_DN26821_c0_g1~~TRINITY_DN26821_c0_g1_i1.p1  ORF type:complete len:638 (+),score=109.00 TRINITY_DN26821_c0_g1_i1:424-2337(+)